MATNKEFELIKSMYLSVCGKASMKIDVFLQDEIGKGHELINCEKVKL